MLMKMNHRRSIHISIFWLKLKENICLERRLSNKEWEQKLKSWEIQRKDQISLETESVSSKS